MTDSFSEIKLFQVKPDKLDAFEELIKIMAPEQSKQEGSILIKYMKRFYTMDGLIEEGLAPRKLSRLVKGVKYYSLWEFETKEAYGKATKWFFDTWSKDIFKLLLMPFDINCGETLY